MKLYLCAASALEYWIQQRKLSIDPNGRLEDLLKRPLLGGDDFARISSINGTPPSDGMLDTQRYTKLRRLARPLHILVSNPAARRNTPQKHCHVWSGPIARGAFVRVDEGVYVSSPMFCYVQLAALLPLIDLVQLGNELFAAYMPSEFSASGVSPCPPLTTPRRCEAFVQHASGMRGTSKVRAALKHVMYGAASPMETIQGMLLCLPKRLGGFGLPKAELNYKVHLPPHARQLWGADAYHCDMYWPHAKVALEYDGVKAHEGHIRNERDIERRNRLSGLGIRVMTATKLQLNDFQATLTLGRQLARLLGVQVRPCRLDTEWSRKAFELRKLLLPPSPFAWQRFLGELS